jgi:LuxR family maltose regulon positive regulatory protein
VALSEAPGTITLGLFASGRLVLTQALEGRLHEAAATYRQTGKLAAARGMAGTPALGVAQVGMGEVLREWNDLGAAEDLLRRGIAHCTAAGGMPEMALEGYLALARVAQARGDGAGALAVLEEAEDLGRSTYVAQSAERVALARARLWLNAPQPDVAAAQRWADARTAAWRAGESPSYVALLEHLMLARLRLMQGQHDEAATLLRGLLERAEAGGLTGCVIEIFVLLARISWEQDQPAPAMIALSRALALAEPAGYIRLFVDEGAPLVALLRRAQERGVAREHVARLLVACGAAEAPAGTPAALLVEPLSAREREVVALLASGLSTAEIAGHLFVTVGTVRNHLKSIYGKLDAHSRLQAVERARTLGLL